MGLKTSEHIGKVIVHPDNENVVFVAAYVQFGAQVVKEVFTNPLMVG